jgi:hypothetical protein
MKTVTQNVTIHKPPAQRVYNASYGGAEQLDPLHGTLHYSEGQLIFVSDAGEFLYPSAEEWYQFGIVHGEVAIAGTQAILDGCRARAERALLEASNRLEPAA